MKSLFTRFSPQNNSQQEDDAHFPANSELPLFAGDGEQFAVPNRLAISSHLLADCQRQLDMLRLALSLNTAALLWSRGEADELLPYCVSSSVESLRPGPYPLGCGITAVLKSHSEVVLAPVREQSPAIPYYQSHRGVGSFLALRLSVPETDALQKSGLGILCVDRESANRWTETERQLISAAAEQLFAGILTARQLFASDRERFAYQRAFEGVRRLNTSLGLSSAFAATAEAVRSVVATDFLSINLAEGDCHRVAYVEGENAAVLAEQSFPLDQGVVGQVLKYGRTLPENADYRGTLPVFSPAHLFADYRSLMIVPLKPEEGPSIGALIIAARQADRFSRSCRELLELIATQVAIKIDLAHAHEKINRLVTVDSLTGIANRRAYQRGFEAMLDRARRRSRPLYLILCDIDHFKRINDNFGHPVGDEVLRQVAGLFERVVRNVDLAARTGGEEFAILLEDTDDNGVRKVAERLRSLIETLDLFHQGQRVEVTVSLGIAAYPQDATSMDKLISCADKALYRAKAEGRNRTVAWNEIR